MTTQNTMVIAGQPAVNCFSDYLYYALKQGEGFIIDPTQEIPSF